MAIYPQKRVPKAKFGFDLSKIDEVQDGQVGGMATMAGELAGNIGKRNLGYGVSYKGVGANTVGEGLKLGGVGFEIGKQFGAPGAVIGAAAGLVGGSIKGLVQGKKMKEDAEKELNQRVGESMDLISRQSRKKYGTLQGYKARSYAKGGKINPDKSVILGGRLHKDGGNPIIYKKTKEKIAETEREELFLSFRHTEIVDSLIAKYDKAKSDSTLEKLGREIQKILLNETVDNSGKFTD